MDGYYGLTNLSHIGVGYYVSPKLLKLKGSPQRRRDDSEPFFKWSVHLGVRIQGFHPCHTGSNPVPTTKKVKPGEVVKVGLKQNYT